MEMGATGPLVVMLVPMETVAIGLGQDMSAPMGTVATGLLTVDMSPRMVAEAIGQETVMLLLMEPAGIGLHLVM